MLKWIKINDLDNVIVALEHLSAGEIIEIDNGIELITDIPMGHKIAISDISKGEQIVKYGMPIGNAICDIKIGEHVHTDNTSTNLSDIIEYEYDPIESPLIDTKEGFFDGYERKNGEVGVRNDLWIIPTVGCINSLANKIANDFNRNYKNSEIKAIAFPHPYGCSQTGDDQTATRKAISALITHPNAGGVLVLGLGCENSNISIIKEYLDDIDTDRIKFIQTQDYEDEEKIAHEKLEELYNIAKEDRRTKIGVSRLIVGLKCGGSDGLSGITANPLIGDFSDIIISQGGTTILTEVPEMFGAEQLLMNRAENEEIYNKIVKLINDFKNYYKKNDQPIYENPSPGNKEGGISTLEDKSNGCIQKSGQATIVDVLDYTDKVTKKGLNLLSAPGNDLVSTTAMALSGAHIILFSTGRGTPYSAPVPTVKISTNTDLYKKKPNWIDFDAGPIVKGKDRKKMAKELYDFVLEVASGRELTSEDYKEWAIFKTGVTL